MLYLHSLLYFLIYDILNFLYYASGSVQKLVDPIWGKVWKIFTPSWHTLRNISYEFHACQSISQLPIQSRKSFIWRESICCKKKTGRICFLLLPPFYKVTPYKRVYIKTCTYLLCEYFRPERRRADHVLSYGPGLTTL